MVVEEERLEYSPEEPIQDHPTRQKQA